MLEFYATDFIDMLRRLIGQMHATRRIAKERGATHPMSKKHRQDTSAVLDAVRSECRKIEIERVEGPIDRLAPILNNMQQSCTYNDIATRLQELFGQVTDGMRDRKFVFVPANKSRYFENDLLFGDQVKMSFPSAERDIKEAGNCFAVGAHTACVFHLMRAAEHAMRVLAQDRKVVLPRKKPIELEQWNKIIQGIESEVAKVGNWPATLGRAAAQQFYNGAVVELRGFKDAWRNHVMHARTNYNEGEAAGVMEYVKAFMVRLSTRLSESHLRSLTKAQWNRWARSRA
jgi:hypothetical protein